MTKRDQNEWVKRYFLNSWLLFALALLLYVCRMLLVLNLTLQTTLVNIKRRAHPIFYKNPQISGATVGEAREALWAVDWGQEAQVEHWQASGRCLSDAVQVPQAGRVLRLRAFHPHQDEAHHGCQGDRWQSCCWWRADGGTQGIHGVCVVIANCQVEHGHVTGCRLSGAVQVAQEGQLLRLRKFHMHQDEAHHGGDPRQGWRRHWAAGFPQGVHGIVKFEWTVVKSGERKTVKLEAANNRLW